MELGHLLTRPGLTYPEVSSEVYHDSFCQLRSNYVTFVGKVKPDKEIIVTLMKQY